MNSAVAKLCRSVEELVYCFSSYSTGRGGNGPFITIKPGLQYLQDKKCLIHAAFIQETSMNEKNTKKKTKNLKYVKMKIPKTSSIKITDTRSSDHNLIYEILCACSHLLQKNLN